MDTATSAVSLAPTRPATPGLNPKSNSGLKASNCCLVLPSATPKLPLLLSPSPSRPKTYLQPVVPDVADAFAPVEAALQEHFLPALLDDPLEQVASLRELASFPVRLAGLGIPDPRVEAPRHHEASLEATRLLSDSLKDAQLLNAQAFSNQAAGFPAQLAFSTHDGPLRSPPPHP
mmetsp:Transcript_4501/g.9682  ORF Transcript_4501/g.9682 Transcript_4501/m.9682 type:complete len:175 (+) Transcript_4501:3-527(+)